MAKPPSLPPQAIEHAHTDLSGLPPVTPPAPPEHELPPASVAIPDAALPLPDHAHVPDWLIG